MRSKVNMQQVYHQTLEAYFAIKDGNGNPVWSPSNPPVISESDLILSAPIVAGMTNANFTINATSGGAAAWEVRLQQTDTFTIARLGIYGYGLIGSSTGPAGTTSYKYWTYAPWQMSSAFIAADPLWNSGQLTMTLNGRQFVKNWLSNKHLQVQRTQMAPNQPITTSGAANNGTIDSIVLGDDGMADVEPTIRFSGSWNNQIAVVWPYGITAVSNYAYVGDANTTYISISYVNMVFNGLLAQNTASILGNNFF
jgi:hypothetical protein